MDPAAVRCALDSSFLIALVSGWHEHHGATIARYEKMKRGGVRILIAGHSLLESYSVLTRLPPPHRMSPEITLRLLSETLATSDIVICGVDPQGYWLVLREMARSEVAGGRVYDAAIAHAAKRAGATALFTWNVRDFIAVAPAGLEIRGP